MPQIPGLPIDEPVAKPHASPQQFGSVGETIAGLGYEDQQMALGAQELAGHLISAQRQLKAKQAEISFGAMKLEIYKELNTATTPEQAQQIYDESRGKLDGVISPFETDKVLSRALGLYRRQEDLEIQGTVNAKKADIITKADKAANATLGEKSLQNAITTTVGGGSPDLAREQFHLQLQSSVTHGTMQQEQADYAMSQWDQDYEKGLIEAYSNSPDPATRKQNINDLKSGESFPHLDKGTTNALLTKAMSRDREITNLAESEDYNGAVNHFDAVTQGWTYGDKVKALESGPWLIQQGFTDANGQPDRKKADMLLEEADRSEARQKRVQTEKDNDIISKHVDAADTGKLTDPQIDLMVQQEGGSVKASSTLKSVMRQHLREVRQQQILSGHSGGGGGGGRASTAEGNRTSAALFRRMAEGGSIDPITDVWDQVDAGKLTVPQARKIEGAYKKVQHEDFKASLDKIKSSPFDEETKGKLGLALTDAVNQQNLQGKAMSEFTDKLLADQGKEKASGFIDRLWNSITGGGPIAANAPTPKSETKPSTPQGRPVTRGGKVIGYTTDGKTMTPAQ